MFLIDTNILAAIKRENTSVINKFDKHEKEIYLSDIVAFEGYYGAEKRNSQKLFVFYDAIYREYPCLVSNLEQAKLTARIKNKLKRIGNTVEDDDIRIAAQALHYNLTLVTDNTKHFARIDDLKIENWLE